MSNPNLDSRYVKPADVAAAISAQAAADAGQYAPKPSTGKNPLTGWFHADGYGAKGDGTTNDTAAIQAAIDAAAAANGGIVRLSAGTYLVTSLTLKQSVTLRSDIGIYNYSAPAHVTIKSTTANAIVIDTPSAGISGCSIEGITILGTNVGSIGVRFQNVSWGSIRRCMVQGFQDQGILLAAGAAAVVEDTLILQCLLNQSRSSLAGALEVRGTDAFITRVEAGCSQSVQSTGTSDTSAILVTGNGNFFTQCVAEFADHAYTVTGRFNTFSSCRGDLSFYHGWQVLSASQSGKNSFTGCVAWDNGRAATNAYAGFYVTATGNTFSGCRPSEDGSTTWNATQKYAFWDASTYSSADQRNEYIGCTGDFSTAMFFTGGVAANTPWPNFPTTISSLSATTYTPPPNANYLEILAIGGGGAGGAGGSALTMSGVATQVGGGGGASGMWIRTVVPATTLTVIAGYGGIAGNGGAVNGNAGANGGSGGPSTVTGTGVAITAAGGYGGRGSAANSTSAAGGAQYAVATSTTSQSEGSGGFASSGIGAGGGNISGPGGGGGSGGAPASATLGGNAGNTGNVGVGGVSASGQTTTANGATPTTPTTYGAGGGGGGGGAPGGAGGNGGTGGAGVVIIRVVG